MPHIWRGGSLPVSKYLDTTFMDSEKTAAKSENFFINHIPCELLLTFRTIDPLIGFLGLQNFI